MTTTINTMLAIYNELATAAGQKPLKAWKGSKDKLQARIDALSPAAKPAKKSTAKPADDGTLTVVQIATELNINPKVARAKLRRRGMTASDGRWARVKRDSKAYKEIVEALTTSKK